MSEKKSKFEDTLKEILSESIMIFREIKQPKGERVAPRIYISTQHLKPKGGLKINQKYKMILIPVKEESKMELDKFLEYRNKKYPGIKLLEYEDICPKCETKLTLIEKISTNPQVPTHRIAFCAKCNQHYDCVMPGF